MGLNSSFIQVAFRSLFLCRTSLAPVTEQFTVYNSRLQAATPRKMTEVITGIFKVCLAAALGAPS